MVEPDTDFDSMSQAKLDATFDPIHDVADRWDLTFEESEVFLESCDYFVGLEARFDE